MHQVDMDQVHRDMDDLKLTHQIDVDDLKQTHQIDVDQVHRVMDDLKLTQENDVDDLKRQMSYLLTSKVIGIASEILLFLVGAQPKHPSRSSKSRFTGYKGFLGKSDFVEEADELVL